LYVLHPKTFKEKVIRCAGETGLAVSPEAHIFTATARRRDFGVAGMAKLAFCDQRARPGNNRASSGGLRARLRLRSRRLPSAHGASGSSRGGSVIPLRVSSGFSPDSSAGVVTSNLTRGF